MLPFLCFRLIQQSFYPNSQRDKEVLHVSQPQVNEPSLEKIKDGIQRMKNNSAPRVDGVSTEMIKFGEEKLKGF